MAENRTDPTHFMRTKKIERPIESVCIINKLAEAQELRRALDDHAMELVLPPPSHGASLRSNLPVICRRMSEVVFEVSVSVRLMIIFAT